MSSVSYCFKKFHQAYTYVIKEKPKSCFLKLLFLVASKTSQNLNISCTFYVSTIESCFCSNLKKFWAKKYIDMSYMSLKMNYIFFNDKLTDNSFLEINLPYSHHLHRRTTCWIFDLLNYLFRRYLDFSKNSFFCDSKNVTNFWPWSYLLLVFLCLSS